MIFKVKEDKVYGYYLTDIQDTDIEIIDKYIKQYNRLGNEKKKLLINEFKEKYSNILITNIITYGNTNTVTFSTLSKFIDKKMIVHNLGEGDKTETKAYRCFNTDNAGFNYKCTIMHEDRMSSWNCLLERLKEPKFVMIYKTKK